MRRWERGGRHGRGGVASMVVVDGQPPLDSVVLNNIPVCGVEKGRHLFLTLDKCTTHTYTCTHKACLTVLLHMTHRQLGYLRSLAILIFLYKIVDTPDIHTSNSKIVARAEEMESKRSPTPLYGCEGQTLFRLGALFRNFRVVEAASSHIEFRRQISFTSVDREIVLYIIIIVLTCRKNHNF